VYTGYSFTPPIPNSIPVFIFVSSPGSSLLWSQLVRHHNINVAPVPETGVRSPDSPHDLGLSKYLAYVPITWFSDSLPSIKTTSSGQTRMLMMVMMIGDWGLVNGEWWWEGALEMGCNANAASLWSALLEWRMRNGNLGAACLDGNELGIGIGDRILETETRDLSKSSAEFCSFSVRLVSKCRAIG